MSVVTHDIVCRLGWDGPNTLYKLGNAARSSGDIAMLKRYLSAGADPNASNFDQRTALHIAASHGNLEAVKPSTFVEV